MSFYDSFGLLKQFEPYKVIQAFEPPRGSGTSWTSVKPDTTAERNKGDEGGQSYTGDWACKGTDGADIQAIHPRTSWYSLTSLEGAAGCRFLTGNCQQFWPAEMGGACAKLPGRRAIVCWGRLSNGKHLGNSPFVLFMCRCSDRIYPLTFSKPTQVRIYYSGPLIDHPPQYTKQFWASEPLHYMNKT